MCSARLFANMKIKLSRKVRHESGAKNRQTKKMKKKNWIIKRSNDNRMIGANNGTCTHHHPYLLCFSPFFFVHNSLLSFIGCACVALIYILQSNHWYRIRVGIEIRVDCSVILNGSAEYRTRNALVLQHRIRIRFGFIYMIFSDTFFSQFVCGRKKYYTSG